jgi:hypothetical protein
MHIENTNPRMLLLGGNHGKWKSKDNPDKINESTGIEAWCYAFEGDYCDLLTANKDEIRQYDIIICNLNYVNETVIFNKILKLLDNCRPDTKLVCMVEGFASEYLKPNPLLLELFDKSDLINVINIHSLPYFRSMTSSKAEFIGIPYPIDKVREYMVPIDQRKRQVVISPFLLSRYSDYLVAVKSGLEIIGFERKLVRTPRMLMQNLLKHRTLNKSYFVEKAQRVYNNPKLMINQEKFFFEYLSTISNSYFAVNLDNRYTWSRLVIDAAVLQIPMITTKSTGHGETFFPQTCIENGFDLEKAIELSLRLVNDAEFYNSVAKYPNDKLDFLRHENMKKRLLEKLGI